MFSIAKHIFVLLLRKMSPNHFEFLQTKLLFAYITWNIKRLFDTVLYGV